MSCKHEFIPVTLSEAQARRLLDNKPVLLKLQHMSGGALDGHEQVHMALSPTQAKRYRKNLASGAGMRILFSKPQAAHHGKRMSDTHGGSFWKRAWSWVKRKVLKPAAKVLKPFARPLLKAAVELVPGLPQAIDLGKQAIEALPGGKQVTGAVDAAVNKAVGTGLRQRKSTAQVVAKAKKAAAAAVEAPVKRMVSAAKAAAVKKPRKPRAKVSGGALAPL